ncbi:hypothetical protein AB0M28_06160 [Streptomyces sp. NPDC051940]|uniref:hypothetical protein n=1 Tax=Streptomyces sp. NPDC051940 TaxID=3155675 RepID=UPI003420767B
MGEALTTRMIMGDQPFAEIGRPVWAVTDERNDCVIAAGDLGHVDWRGRGAWKHHRVGVYEAGDLRTRHVIAVRHAVCAIAVHPQLPLAAVGTGQYDGTWDFHGQLLLLHLRTGRVTALLSKSRQVRHLRWLDDGRLAMLLSPEDKDGGFGKGFELAVAADDWLTAPAGLVDPDAVSHPMVPSGLLYDPGAAERLTELAAAVGSSWRRRGHVRAVAATADGRVLATGAFTDLECFDPSGAPRWSLPAEGEGSADLRLSPDGESAWVTHRGFHRDPATGRHHDRAPVAHRVSTATGDRLDEVTLASAVGLTDSAEGWLALRDLGRADGDTVLMSPAHREHSRLATPARGTNAPPLHIRHSTRLLYAEGPGPDTDATWLWAIEPPGAHGPAARRPLFPVDWDPDSSLHPWPGPGLETETALVHAGRTYDPGRSYADGREGTYIAGRRVPDGSVAWLRLTDLPLADVDGDEHTVYAAYRSGEVEALNTTDGTLRWRRTAMAHGHPVTPLCLTYAAGRLLIGTVDGRVLDCAVPDR